MVHQGGSAIVSSEGYLESVNNNIISEEKKKLGND
jgi:hypothetical protein